MQKEVDLRRRAMTSVRIHLCICVRACVCVYICTIVYLRLMRVWTGVPYYNRISHTDRELRGYVVS